MLGFLGIFGRAHDLRQLEQAMRDVDFHPRLATDAVKITAINLLREHAAPASPAQRDIARTAELIAYCMIGAEGFAGANDESRALAVEARIDKALMAGDSLDARIVLLLLHAQVIQPSVVAHFGLAAEPA